MVLHLNTKTSDAINQLFSKDQTQILTALRIKDGCLVGKDTPTSREGKVITNQDDKSKEKKETTTEK